ncbi:MAG: sigma-70 family RNA polymerase sigma factor, partial [Ruthenibacterium sp.]
SIGDDELNGEELIRDVFIDVEDEAITSVMVHKLREALLQLSDKELELITALFFLKKSQRDVADKYGISQPAVKKRQDKILSKLRKEIKI